MDADGGAMTSRLRSLVVLATAVVAGLLVPGSASPAVAAGATPATDCPRVEAPFTGYGRWGFNQGVPWTVDLGPEVDAGESWVRATQVDTSPNPRPDAVKDYPLHGGYNSLRAHAGRDGWTTVAWHLARPGLEPCDGSLFQHVTDVAKERPYPVISSPENGQVFEQHEAATYTFTCEYEGSTPVVPSCQTKWGPPGDADGVVTQQLDTSTPGWNWVTIPLYMQKEPAGAGTLTGVGSFYYYVHEDGAPQPHGQITTTLTLAQRDVATGEWVDLDPSDQVVAGDEVRVTTAVHNGDDRHHDVEMRVRDVSSGDLVHTGAIHDLSLTPGSTWERWSFWDTADLAWLDGVAPRTGPAKVAVTLTADGNPAGTTYAQATIVPRPVILVHGWKSYAASSWGSYQEILTAAHPGLRGYAVGDGQFPGTMNTNGGGTGCDTCRTNTLPENAAQEATYIQAVREATGAEHVDIVAHSMGGLISRYYVQELMPESRDAHPVAMRLVQMGTPNMGSELADMMMALGGGDSTGIPYYPASLHLTTSWVRDYFNQTVTQLRGVRISNLVGTRIPLVGMPLRLDLYGDGIVPADSARWTLADTVDSPNDFHTAMTESEEDFTDYVLPRLTADLAHGFADRAPADRGSTRAGADATPAAPAGRDSQVTATRSVRVPRNGSVDVPVVLENATSGALAVADGVWLQVLDATGTVVATSSDTPGALPQVVVPGGTVPAGPATLRVTDLDDSSSEVDLLTYVAGSPLSVQVTSELDRTDAGVLARLRAEVVDAGTAVAGATVSARLVGREADVLLSDDGQHGDGAAGDGVYGAALTDLPDGEHLVVVTATGSGRTRIVPSVLMVDAAALPLEEPEEPEEPGEEPGEQPGEQPEDPQQPGGSHSPHSPDAATGSAVLAQFDTLAKRIAVPAGRAKQLRRLVVSAVDAYLHGPGPAADAAVRRALGRLDRKVANASRHGALTRAQARKLTAFSTRAVVRLTAAP